jgi:putative heme iron utilization protein
MAKVDQHANPTREEPLTPDDTRAPTHAERARTMVSLLKTGTLSTLGEGGYPHGSYVTFAMHGPNPVFLVSKLATHTQNLMKDPRASLMAHESHAEDPLANGRVTLLGPCERLDDEAEAREAYLAAQPQAEYYVDFADFSFYELRVESLRYIGGYGRMSWVDVEEWRAAEPDPLAPHAEGIIGHMNDDHADALVAYARAFTRATDTDHAVMTGVDRYGFEMSVRTPKGMRPARLAFETEVTTPTDARKALVALVKTARAQLDDR